MLHRKTEHTTFTIERSLDFAPSKVFAAWASAEAKSQWFVGPADRWTLIKRELDFRVGGREKLVGAFVGGPVSTFDALYYEIVPDERIIYSYDMHQDKKQISVSLATIAFRPAKRGTTLVFTEQATFLDDFNDNGGRKLGTGLLLDQLVASFTR